MLPVKREYALEASYMFVQQRMDLMGYNLKGYIEFAKVCAISC